VAPGRIVSAIESLVLAHSEPGAPGLGPRRGLRRSARGRGSCPSMWSGQHERRPGPRCGPPYQRHGHRVPGSGRCVSSPSSSPTVVAQSDGEAAMERGHGGGGLAALVNCATKCATRPARSGKRLLAQALAGTPLGRTAPSSSVSHLTNPVVNARSDSARLSTVLVASGRTPGGPPRPLPGPAAGLRFASGGVFST